jgi:hypothetical protein
VERLMAIPGVVAAAFSQLPPAGLDIPPSEFHIVGRDPSEKTFSISRSASAGYFRTLHIPILQGDTCSADPAEKPFSKALVTRAFVDRYFAGEQAIGRSVTSPGLPPGTFGRIVGITGDVRESGVIQEVQPIVYWCGYHPYWPDQYFLVRALPRHPLAINTIREALREIEPRRALYGAQQLTESLSESLAAQRFNMILLGLFAGTALLLAAVGLYGVLSQLVSSRRREIGVRMALGAQPRFIVRSVLRDAALMTAAGVVAGLAGALAMGRLMASLVFGVSTRDPLTFVAVPLILAAVAGAAAFIPARRAAQVDPALMLRDG